MSCLTKLEKLLCLKYLGRTLVENAMESQMTKLLFPLLQETTWLVFWSSTSSYVLVRKGVGPTSWSPSIGLAMDGSPEFSGPNLENSSFTKPEGFMIIQTEKIREPKEKLRMQANGDLDFLKRVVIIMRFSWWVLDRKGKSSRIRKVQFDRWRSYKKKKNQKLDSTRWSQNKSFIGSYQRRKSLNRNWQRRKISEWNRRLNGSGYHCFINRWWCKYMYECIAGTFVLEKNRWEELVMPEKRRKLICFFTVHVLSALDILLLWES